MPGRTDLVLQANSVKLSQRESPGGFGRQSPQLLRRQRNIFQDGQMREEVILLKHHADTLAEFVGIVAQHRPAVEQDVTAVGLMQPVEAPQQGRLSPAGWPDNGHRAARGSLDIDTAQHLCRAEGLVNILGFQRY